MNKIPKIIHYCWFGGNQLPELAEKCIQSWKQHCPDYKIIRWDESNFNLNCNRYVKEAYEAKKWAFVTDYVRLFALYHHGGIYMDTDVEVLKPLDKFLEHRAFTGCENEEMCVTGTMAAEKGHKWLEDLLNYYKDKKFILWDGSLNTKTNTKIITETTICKYGWIPKNEYQVLKEGLHIYPFDYFCAKDWNDGQVYITDRTYTVHHFSGSWHSEKEKKEHKKQVKFINFFGKQLGLFAYNIDFYIRKYGFTDIVKKIVYKLENIINKKTLSIFKTVVPTKSNYIFFESEGDFCDNARALYQYMIEKNFNNKYKIVWKVSDSNLFKEKYNVKNVKFVSNNGFFNGLILNYYIAKCKYFFFTHPHWLKNWKKDQVVVHLSHGIPIKGSSGVDLSNTFDYILCSSERTKEWNCKFWGAKHNQNIVLGAPRNDLLFENKNVISLLLGSNEYDKVILCMPTFKQSKYWEDSDEVIPYAIQGIKNEEELKSLNNYLESNNSILLVKIHHLQKTDILTKVKLSNIIYIEDKDLMGKDIQLYNLIGEVDALLTDYSSVYLDYILLDRPIGFLHADIHSYIKGRGFLVYNYLDFMPGDKIYTVDDLFAFISKVKNGIDEYKIERKNVNEVVNTFRDNKNCERGFEYFIK